MILRGFIVLVACVGIAVAAARAGRLADSEARVELLGLCGRPVNDSTCILPRGHVDWPNDAGCSRWSDAR